MGYQWVDGGLPREKWYSAVLVVRFDLTRIDRDLLRRTRFRAAVVSFLVVSRTFDVNVVDVYFVFVPVRPSRADTSHRRSAVAKYLFIEISKGAGDLECTRALGIVVGMPRDP